MQKNLWTKSQYFEVTFSIMVRCASTFEPVNLAIDEDYEKLSDDFNRMFAETSTKESVGTSKRLLERWMTQMKVI